MNRVREKQHQNQKLQRSRSKSPNNSKVIVKNSSKGKIIQKGNVKSNHNLNKSRSKSPQRSPNKKNNGNLGKSKSEKKIDKSKSNKNLDLKKSGNNSRVNVKNIGLQKSPIKKSPIENKNSSIVKQSVKNKNSPKQQPVKQNIKKATQKQVQSNIKNQQKQMGIIFYRPEHDKIIFKPLEATDQVFQKYLDMVSNDNDSSYVVNALPQLITMKKEDDSTARDFVSGKITRLGGTFDNLNADKMVNFAKKLPHYYNGQCGKNLSTMKIILQTKFKVEVDLGFLLYSLDGDKLTVFRIYISKIYRKMNYLGFIYMQIFKMLMSKHSGADRWSIFVLERNIAIHKFFKYLGLKIQKIYTQSYNKVVDYFQEFTIKKKQLSTVVSSMK